MDINQLERIQRYEGEESVKVEVIQELEREYDTTQKKLKELEVSTESRRRREIQTLRRFGVMDSVGIRYSLPDIEISHSWIDSSSVAEHTEVVASDDDEGDEVEEEDESFRKKRTWKALGWLTVSPLFRQRSKSETPSRKYRAMSAGVVAGHSSSTVQNLRRLYTGRSEFYDVDDEPEIEPISPKPSFKKNLLEETVSAKSSIPINQKSLEEIDRFENLIKNYFRNKEQKRY